jgi:putative transposase
VVINGIPEKKENQSVVPDASLLIGILNQWKKRMLLRRTYKYRLYPTRNQIRILDTTLNMCRDLYNSALQERIEAYKKSGISLWYANQSNELPKLKELNPQYELIYAQVLQDVLRRLDKTFKNFFRRIKNHETPGFPRFKGENRYNSFTYPQNANNAFNIISNKLHLSKIGDIKLKLSGHIQGTIKTCTIVRKINKYYACFSVEIEKDIKPRKVEKVVGIDVGIKSFAVLSDGTQISNPIYLKQSEKKLAKEQRRLSRKKKGSSNRKKQRIIVAKVYEHIVNQRTDFQHKLSRQLVNSYDKIFVEDLQIKNMVKNHRLAKSISDASWGNFIQKLEYKAEEAGIEVRRVNPQNTSRICHVCGYINKDLKLSDRTWVCPICNTKHDRDVNAAVNILVTGINKSTVGSTGIYACGEIGQQDCSMKQEFVLLKCSKSQKNT